MKHIPQKLRFSYNNSKPVDIEFHVINEDIYMSTEDLIPALQSTQLLTVGIIALKSKFLGDYSIQYKNDKGITHYYLNFLGFISFTAMVIELKDYNVNRLIAIRKAVKRHLDYNHIEELLELSRTSYDEGKKLILNQFDNMAGKIREARNA